MSAILKDVEKLADDAYETTNLSFSDAIQLSQAISLKRIADKLELTSKPPVAIMNAEDLENYRNMWNTFNKS
jgi:hypothetical protein